MSEIAPRRLLAAPINRRDLVQLSVDRRDAISRHVPRVERFTRAPSSESREDHVQRRLGHISSNPSDPDNRNAIRTSYAFNHLEGDDELLERPLYVNKDYETTDAFVTTMMDEAKQQQRLALKTARGGADMMNAAQRMFILHGPRGSGKTFYLNYILSEWIERFESENILWIRIDLVKDFGPNNNLTNWIYGQITKITFRYYDRRSAFYESSCIDVSGTGLEEHLRKVATEYPYETERPRMQESLVRMIKVFRGEIKEQALDESLVPPLIGAEVFSFLIDRGFRFIIVLDGFDKLEATRASLHKFQSVCAQAATLGIGNDLVGFTLLLAMRTVTFDSLPSGGPYRRVEPLRIYEVAPPDLAEIVGKRRQLLAQEVAKLAEEKGWRTSDWPSHLDEYIAFLDKSGGDENYATVLDHFFGDNRRAQMQMLQLAYYDFLGERTRNQERGSQYRLIEAMTKAGYRYVQKHYRYESDGRKIRQTLGDPTGFDNRLIPSIFDYPFLAEISPRDFNYRGSELLSALRLMQLIHTYEQVAQKEPARQPLVVSEIQIIMERCFGYDMELVKWKLVELSEYDVIYLYGEYVEFDDEIPQMRVRGLPKLEYMINKYIGDIAYLSLAVMRAPIGGPGSNVTGPFTDSSGTPNHDVPFVGVISYQPGGSNLLQWIAAKSLNAISAFRILDHLNSVEEAQAKGSIDKLPARGRYREIVQLFFQRAPFDYIRNLMPKIGDELEALLRGKVTIGRNEFRPIDDAYVKRVYNEYTASCGS
jgi:hypothetical protein